MLIVLETLREEERKRERDREESVCVCVLFCWCLWDSLPLFFAGRQEVCSAENAGADAVSATATMWSNCTCI